MRFNISNYNLIASIFLIFTILIVSSLIGSYSVSDTYSSEDALDQPENYLGENYKERFSQDQRSDDIEAPDSIIERLIDAISSDRLTGSETGDLFPSNPNSSESEHHPDFNSSETMKEPDFNSTNSENRSEINETEEENFWDYLKDLKQIFSSDIWTWILIGLLGTSLYLLYNKDIDLSGLVKKFIHFLQGVKEKAIIYYRVFMSEILSFCSEKASSLWKLFRRIKQNPKNTIQIIGETKNKCFYILTGFPSLIISRLRSDREKGRDSKLFEIWKVLKQRANLQNKKSITPKEVQKKAINKGLDPSTVYKVVEAFRLDRYSSKDYKEEIKVENLEEDLNNEVEE